MLLEECVYYDQCILLENSISLCSASFCTLRPNLPVTSYFCIPAPCNEKDIFFWVLIIEGLVGLHRTAQLSFFSITGQAIDLDYHDIECFALETNRDHSVVFEIVSKYCILDSC